MNITRNKDNGTMQRSTKARKRDFLRALANVGLSQAGWARDQGISPAHLSLVLSGKRDSLTLMGKIDAFTREHAGKQGARVA